MCLLGLTGLAYTPSLGGDYVYEDSHDGALPADDWSGWPATIGSVLSVAPSYSGTMAIYRVVGHLTAMSPLAQRGISLSLHLLNGLLLWWIASRLWPPSGALLAAGLFLLHPIQTESVAYIAARSELVMGLALLLALLVAERGWPMLAWVFAASAVVSKPAGGLVLLLVPLWAWWRRLPTWTPTTYVLWGVACWTPFLVALGIWQARPLAWASPEMLGGTVAAWTRLLALWVLPWGQTIDHDWARVPLRVGVGAGLLWAGGLCWAVRRRESWWGLVTAWSGLLVLPRAIWQLGEGLHEHHLYAATIPLSLATGALWAGRRV